LFCRVIAHRGRLVWPNFFSLCPYFLLSCAQPRLGAQPHRVA
jgi:hypothetical protein